MVHEFLSSIGFRNIKKDTEIYKILQNVLAAPDEHAFSFDSSQNEIACFSKMFGDDFGITICGCFLKSNEFHMEYYYPFFRGTYISTREHIEAERLSGKTAYAGICDELKLGVTLIFYVENMMDLLARKKLGQDKDIADSACLGALGLSGKILLPVEKTKEQVKKSEKQSEQRLNLMQQARNGDWNAMENLTLSDMDMYSNLTRRVATEDVLTIVESSFMPYGVESDQYLIIGEITNVYSSQNVLSGEKVWILSITCNDIIFDVCINEEDLLGEPEIGRRFKGHIWMQGRLNFGY